jgi:protein tyrosine phosphatase
MKIITGLVNRFKGAKSEPQFKKGHVKLDVSKITDQLYVGTNSCCQAHYTSLLIDAGVLHDLSIEGEQVDTPFGVESYLWLPTPDHTAPSERSFELGINYIDTVLKTGGKVFIHCTNGHGRAPTMAVAWFIKQGMTTDKAIKTIKEKRPEIHIEPAQLKALKLWEKRCRDLDKK